MRAVSLSSPNLTRFRLAHLGERSRRRTGRADWSGRFGVFERCVGGSGGRARVPPFATQYIARLCVGPRLSAGGMTVSTAQPCRLPWASLGTILRTRPSRSQTPPSSRPSADATSRQATTPYSSAQKIFRRLNHTLTGRETNSCPSWWAFLDAADAATPVALAKSSAVSPAPGLDNRSTSSGASPAFVPPLAPRGAPRWLTPLRRRNETDL